QEVGRRRARLRLLLGEPDGRVERKIDVMAKQQVAGRRRAVEEREAIAARLGRGEEFAIVVEIEGAAQKSHFRHKLGTHPRHFPRYARRGWRVDLSSPPRVGLCWKSEVGKITQVSVIAWRES